MLEGEPTLDYLRVSNQGCSSADPWPYGECAEPWGQPTTACVSGGAITDTYVRETSSLFIASNGAQIVARDSATVQKTAGDHGSLSARESAVITMTAGWVSEVSARDSASVRLLGGRFDSMALYVVDDASIVFAGASFDLDGLPQAFGNPAPGTGVITGTSGTREPIEIWADSRCGEGGCRANISLIPVEGDLLQILDNGEEGGAGGNLLDASSGTSITSLFVRDAGCPGEGSGPFPDAECEADGTPTGLELAEGASVGDDLRVFDHSVALMSGGTIGDTAAALHTARIDASGGSIGRNLVAMGSAHVSLAGAEVTGDLVATGSATAALSSGVVGGHVVARGSARVRVAGGSMEFLRAHDESRIEIEGSDFEILGVPVPYGELEPASGTLTGTLASGESIQVTFWQNGSSYWRRDIVRSEDVTGRIVLMVPEPGSLASGAAVVLSLTLLRFRRKR